MSAAAPTANAGAAPAKKGKKKLIIIVGMLLLVLAIAGGAAVVLMKNKAHADAEGEDAAAPAEHKSVKIDPKHAPSYLPLDAFVVNLADKDADRYAQIGITLEIDDAHTAETMKVYMPAIRSAILMILSHKTSADLLSAEGKEALAAEIMRESVRPIGIDIDPPEADEASTKSKDSAEDEAPKKKSKKKKKGEEHNPVQHVLFSNFIIQ
ncbi:N/A [soil metagenome]